MSYLEKVMNSNRGFIKLPLWVLDSSYYQYVLSDADKNILNYLWANVSIGNSKYYKRGLLVANIKEDTLVEKSGKTRLTLIRHLSRLDDLGVIIKVRRKMKHNRYVVGFRSKSDDRLYLLYHLIGEYERLITQNIGNQVAKFNKKHQHPSIKDISPYKLDSGYRIFISDHLDDLKTLCNGIIKDGKTIYESLFYRTDIYKKPYQKQEIEAPIKYQIDTYKVSK